jgi:hypothetical protein
MLSPPRGSQLTGQPMSLPEVVLGASSRAEQSQRIEAYWDLCSSVADYYLGLREQEELQGLRAAVPSEGSTWQQALSELAVRVGTSQRAAIASQYRLASLMRSPLGALPLPSDRPHCGNYHTRYDEIFANRPSSEAQQLSHLLPLRYAELMDAAAAVARSEDWVRRVATATNSTDLEAIGTRYALELLALRRRAFVQIARDYNRRIARYAELATPGEIESSRLIGMLIMRDAPSTATRGLLSAPPDRQSNIPGTSTPRTFGGEWEPVDGEPRGTFRDDAVAPASAEGAAGRREERSLLVPQ